ncbi:hypothetical protein SLEP1_g56050 [Rubroshorea leprosula]|uniref:Zinc knuckle CX2CX4HX4C domain-containing protein n=1 Tax=Rubroshorea leprosula TaxID=152421 RepID=A0AAV5MKC8_9ROSI|nr:hypothetical protein SLEP1_g56050 [Rubroshorea leprosula]
MSRESIQLIGSLFPRLISWDQSTLGGLESFLRLRVEIDVQNPLPIGFQFQQQRDEIWHAEFKYEKLVDFYYSCRRLGHTNKSCADFNQKDNDSNHPIQVRPQYGPQLRVATYSPKRQFRSIREGNTYHQNHHAKLLPEATNKSQTGCSLLPTHSAQQNTVVNEEEPSELGRVEQQEEERVNSSTLSLSTPAFNEMEMQSYRGMITIPDISAESSSLSSATHQQTPPPLNAMMTTLQLSALHKHLHIPPDIQDQAIGCVEDCCSVELGLLLSQKVEAQLLLGSNISTGKKRRCDTGPSIEAVKRACIAHNELLGLQYFPTPLQDSIALGRPESYQQEQKLMALARQVKLQPDPCLSLNQQFHPTHRLLNEPLVTPMIFTTTHAPGTPSTYLLNSPSRTTEQLLDAMANVASVAGPWQPPSPT